MLQGYIDNKEERERIRDDRNGKKQKSSVPENEGAETTPVKEAKDKDAADPRDAEPPAPPVAQRSESVAVPSPDDVARRALDEELAWAAQPKIDVDLQYAGIPTHAPLKMKALVTAKPGVGTKPKVADVVMILDESLSMGQRRDSTSAASLLSKFCVDLFTNGVPDVELNLRVLLFGGEVVDKKIGTTELVTLNDKSRESFLAIARDVDGRQGSTAIGEPILKAVQILKDHRDQMLNSGLGMHDRTDVPPSQHIVVLTDGGANAGAYVDGQTLHDTIKEQVGDCNIFCHFIGVGPSINPQFITTVTDNGKVGVFASAPLGQDIAKAYEEIFGFALETRMSLNLKITDADGERIERLGMLMKERNVLVDVTAPRNDSPGEHNWLKIALLDDGGAEAVHCTATAEWFDGATPQKASDKVKEAMEIEEVNAKMVEIQKTSHSLEHATQRMRTSTADATSQGAYGAAALRRMEAMTDTIEEESQTYRSLGAQASMIYAARSATQSQYY